MIKETVEYTDFNDAPKRKDLHFHISKTELIANMDLKDQIEALAGIVDGEPRDLSSHEVKAIFAAFKRVVKLAYGERSDDGDLFIKSEEIWQRFEQSAAYDTFIWNAFTGGQDAFEFINRVLPQDLREEADKHPDMPKIPTPRMTEKQVEADEDPEIEIPGRGKVRLSQLRAEAAQ